jgi:L-iditol 2-dehydrogenase
MKAILYKGIKQVVLEDVPMPKPKEGEALLRVKAATICGTDMRIINHGHHTIKEADTRILGHEIAGVIEEVTPSAAGLKVGEKVAVAPNVHCGSCFWCASDETGLCENISPLGITYDGGFAEFMVIPQKAISQGNIIPVADDTDLVQAALNEPLSCCFNSLECTEMSFGKNILIIGAGPIGIMHAILANRMGAAKVIVSEVSDERLAEIRKFGADVTINPAKEDLKKRVMDETKGRGVEVAIVACPVAAVHNDAIECLAQRGQMNLFGGLPKDRPMTSVNANAIHYRHLKMVGTSRQSILQYQKTLSLIELKKIDLGGLISGRFSLDEHEKAFDLAQRGVGLKNVFVM